MQFLVGFAFAFLIALIAWRLKFLSLSGAIAAVLLGTIVFGFGGLSWSILLVGFFAAISMLSLAHKNLQNSELTLGAPKRTAWQVLANGGVAGLFMLFHALFPTDFWPWVGFSASLAAASADTWSTEIGILSKTIPVSILTGKPVDQGTSGGITLIGSLGGFAGAAFIAILSVLLAMRDSIGSSKGLIWVSFAIILVFGFLGSFIDSAIGAAWQVSYWCPACGRSTEMHPLHSCGTQTTYQKGIKGLDNNWVNAINTTHSGILAALVLLFVMSFH